MRNIKAILWLSIIVLALFGALIWFGIEFKSRGDELKAEKVLTDSLTIKVSSLSDGLRLVKSSRLTDSLNYSKIIEDTQKSCSEMKKDRDYWKDYAEKIESGKYCPELYGWLKKKKRLVRCVPP